ncbi:corticotropin-releasing factor-binding protein isoform X1 [Zonotrichia albicollis]|uniref:corticotropin-releasing factor-binding protein isoform X1 n=1 Tax=Zonotrichia albicollis TaxID=44394 RepID=UPI003D810224
MGYPISTGTKCLPSQQLYKKSRSKTPQRLLHTGTDPEKPGHGGRPPEEVSACHLLSSFNATSFSSSWQLPKEKPDTWRLFLPSVFNQVRDAGEDDPFLLLSEDLKRELSAGQIYRRSLRCIDMLSIEGQFTFTADQPQLHCATFFIGEPEELITIHSDFVNIDCQGGDFLKVFDGWILKGEKFPSSLDHPLTTSQRYVDFCESGNIQRTIRSSQNVAMIFFRIQLPGNGFTVTVKKSSNLFPCNVISQTPSGRFTMVIPHQHRNCSFSIIYPVVIKISDLILGHLNGLFLKKPSASCAGVGDFVELLGGAGLDPSKMFPLADLCHSFHGSAQMKIGCDNTVLRMVSSGKHINRVTFEYHQLDLQETETRKENSIEEFCFPSI